MENLFEVPDDYKLDFLERISDDSPWSQFVITHTDNNKNLQELIYAVFIFQFYIYSNTTLALY